MCNFYFLLLTTITSPSLHVRRSRRQLEVWHWWRISLVWLLLLAQGCVVVHIIYALCQHTCRPSKALTEPGAWAWAPNKLRVSTLVDRAIRLLVHVLVRACVIYWAIDLDYIEVGSGPARRYPVALPLPLPLSVTSLLKFASASAR